MVTVGLEISPGLIETALKNTVRPTKYNKGMPLILLILNQIMTVSFWMCCVQKDIYIVLLGKRYQVISLETGWFGCPFQRYVLVTVS